MDQTLKYGSWTMSGTAGGRIGANSCAGAWRASSAKIRVRVNRNPRYSIISLTLFREIRGRQIREEFHGLRARQEIRCTFCCWPPGPLARRERRAYPLRYVRSEQHSQRACGPQPGGARRRAGICGVAAPRRCHHIACVAAPCICPPGARAKMHTLFSDGPLAPFTTETRRYTENPEASVKPPCPPCLRGETGCLAAAGSPSQLIMLSCPHDAPNESGGRPDSADVSGAPDSGRRGSRVWVAGIRRHGFSQAGSGGPALS